MNLYSQAFLGSPYNFFDHKESCAIYNEAWMLSGLAIKNELGLDKPLTFVYKNNGCPALDSNDENIFSIPRPITNLANDKFALATEVENRIKILSVLYKLAPSIIDIEPEFLIAEAINLVHPFRWYVFGHLHDSLAKLYNVKPIEYCRENVRYIIADPCRITNFEDHLAALVGHAIAKEQIIKTGREKNTNR